MSKTSGKKIFYGYAALVSFILAAVSCVVLKKVLGDFVNTAFIAIPGGLSVLGVLFLVKKYGSVFASFVASILSAGAGVLFYMVEGTFGKAMKNYYDPMIVGLLAGVLVVVILLVIIEKYGLASLAATAMPGIALCCFFCKGAYWHFVDVFMAIDEPGFDPMYLLFVGLMLAAFIFGEIAVYARKPIKQNA